MAKKQKSVEEVLQDLADLQKIDSKLDQLRQIRGGLPEEVRELEDELAGLEARLNKIQGQIDEANDEIKARNTIIKDSEANIRKYDKQLMEVKNNREYEALTKEIELAKLEIMTCERKINQFNNLNEELDAKRAEVQGQFDDRKEALDAKRQELEEIVKETEAEEVKLLKESEKQEKNIEDRLLHQYKRVRGAMRNGLAVVPLDRDACGGCFTLIPPQQMYEIRQKKTVVICENCGRYLVDKTFFMSKAEIEALEAATVS